VGNGIVLKARAGLAMAALSLAISGCRRGQVQEPTQVARGPTSVPAALLPTPTQAPPDPGNQESFSCQEPATEIAMEVPFSGQTIGGDGPRKIFLCILVPEGVSQLVFELTGATADLDLFVGYPDMDAVQHGGLWFWHDEGEGAGDRTILVEPALMDYVNAGSYYIEVSASPGNEASPFTLTVSGR